MKKIIFLSLSVLFFAACDKEDSIDTEKPEINISIPGAFPVQCSEIKRGESFTFRAEFTDNEELGSFGIDIHHNFNHHSHSTETETCSENDVKAPVNPFKVVENYPIPEGLKRYVAEVDIYVPEDVDTGDYHFLIKVTDKEGWQAIRGLSIDIIE